MPENWYIILYDVVSRLWYIATSGPFCKDASQNYRTYTLVKPLTVSVILLVSRYFHIFLGPLIIEFNSIHFFNSRKKRHIKLVM